MIHDLKIAAFFSHDNVVFHITSYQSIKFHTDIITSSLNLNINLVRTEGMMDTQTKELYARPGA